MYPSVGDVANEGSDTCMGKGDLWENFVPFPQFCYDPKTAQNIILNF